MATRPAIAPLPAMPTSIDLVLSQMTPSATTAPAAAASCVFNATSAKKLSVVPNVEPALNPYQPTHSRRTPRPTRGIECPGIARGEPSEPYLPRLAPRSRSAASPPTAPVRWTTDEPAKSMTGLPPMSDRKPPPYTECATSG